MSCRGQVAFFWRSSAFRYKLASDWLIFEEKTMASITAFEAKTRFGQLLARVARGEEVVITKHEKPVARIVPEGRRHLQSVRSAVAGIFQLRKEIGAHNRRKSKLSYAEVKSWIEEGRS
jgi:prevent-host-death family protein